MTLSCLIVAPTGVQPRVFLSVLLSVFVFVTAVTSSGSSVEVLETPPAQVTDVHVVFSNHFDCGFDGIDPVPGFAYNVINKYFDEFIPLALDTAERARQAGTERYIWTMEGGGYLLSLYLFDCDKLSRSVPGPIHCPNATMIQRVKQALSNGDIAWHAMPFNGEPELADSSLFAVMFQVNADLDSAYNKHYSRVMIQRDVPGMTSAVIPHLRKYGVQAVSIGTNPASAPVGVAKVSLWRDELTGEEIVLLYHAFGYGDIEWVDNVEAPGTGVVLSYAWLGDNEGPHTLEQMQQVYSSLHKLYPNANVHASTLDEFVQVVLSVKNKLTVVTGEQGDTWIYGVPTDPLRQSKFRAVKRARNACYSQQECHAADPAMRVFDFLVMKVVEHTNGGDVKKLLNDTMNWSNDMFHRSMQKSNFQQITNTWVEQRQYLDNAIASVDPASALGKLLQQELSELRPSFPALQGYTLVNDWSTVFSLNGGIFGVSFDQETGALNGWKMKDDRWFADSQHVIGLLSYQSYDSKDYKQFFSMYQSMPDEDYFPLDFGKPGVDVANPKSHIWKPAATQLYVDNPQNPSSIVVVVQLDKEAHQMYGAPLVGTIEYKVITRSDSDQIGLDITLQWFNKTATRLPEALWFGVNPKVLNPLDGWTLSKIGHFIDPLEVIVNGSFHLHAVDEGLFYTTLDPRHDVSIVSVDAPLVSVGVRSAFPTPFTMPDISDGFFFNLVNNLWGTNYPQWYPFMADDDNAKFRFQVLVAK